MSHSTQIFVNGTSLEDLAVDIESLTGIHLTFDSDCGSPCFTGGDGRISLALFDEHGYENDRHLKFEDFRYEIDIQALNADDPEGAEGRQLEFAWNLFERLKQQAREAMLVDNLQHKLAEHRLP